MKNLKSWLSHQSLREKRTVFLEDALLSNRFIAYAFYRLRYFFLRFFIDSTTHTVRVIFLYFIFPSNEFIHILLLHVGAGLINSFWWGMLEVMRGRVRYLRRYKKPHLIPNEIGRWLSLSIQLSIAVMAAGIIWLVWLIWHKNVIFGPEDLYSFFIFLQLSVSLITRCYHSGIYAIKRIYRPPLAIISVEIFSLLILLILWPLFGSWSFPVSALFSTIFVALLTLYYTSRSYDYYKFAPFNYIDIMHLNLPFGKFTKEAIIGGLSYTVMHMDSLLVLTLFHTRDKVVQTKELFILFFFLAPVIRAGFDWAQLFYFDLKKLEITLFKNLRRRFENYVSRLSLFMGFAFWALACIISTFVYQRNLEQFYMLMIPFFVSRSLLAAAQIQAFSEKGYKQLLKTGAFFIIGLVLVSLIVESGEHVMIFLSIIILVSFLMLKRRQDSESTFISRLRLFPLLEWIVEIRKLKKPVCISAASFSIDRNAIYNNDIEQWEKDNRWKNRKLLERIAARLGGFGGVTFIYPNCFVWYERSAMSLKITDEWLRSQGGLINIIRSTGMQKNGLMALTIACNQNLLGKDMLCKSPRSKYLIGDIKRMFSEMFPNGVIYDPNEPIPPLFNSLSSKEKRIILYEAMAFARDLRISRARSLFEVTALCIVGELRLIFLVSSKENRKLKSRWQDLILRLNLNAAFDADVHAL